MTIRSMTIVAILLLVTSAVAAAAAVTPERKCQSGKNKAAGKYAACLQNAEAKLVVNGDVGKYGSAVGKCEDKFAKSWQKEIDKAMAAMATCPDSPLTGPQFKAVIDEHSDNITTALGGGGLEDCPAELAQCQGDLAACLASTLPAARILKTGQTGCYDVQSNGIPCAGTGQDGELQKGVARSYTDNGDGTITDNQTGLMWEKKSDDGSIHDKDNTYSWSDAFDVFVAGLNTVNFAGHGDWRVPNRFELETLIDLGNQDPAVGSAFNDNCGANSSGNAGCLVTGCSCTPGQGAGWWSSTTFPGAPVLQPFAWTVFFFLGNNGEDLKTNPNYVRAVRDAP